MNVPGEKRLEGRDYVFHPSLINYNIPSTIMNNASLLLIVAAALLATLFFASTADAQPQSINVDTSQSQSISQSALALSL